ncbi:hypothetical protein BOTCAL_0108g00310 [Botryotinia calthae]|uniref:Uncharacterized protein n=1 Tax=Botryotinia calthae TaxID=38488 RepID=A0A4Y8D851_9HELO|nr:hypothetical protein BOTCAL_0108g00310 [Botryotinia calthae]
MAVLGGLTYDITDPLTHKAAGYFALEIYEPLFTMAHKTDFLDEDAIILELIPGIPFQEFDGTSAFQNNVDVLDILHHNVTSKRIFNEGKRLENRDAQVKIPPNNDSFERVSAVLADMTCIEDKEKTMDIVFIENDYPNCFARSYVDFIKFAASLAHPEGFYFKTDSSDINSGI